MTHLLLRQGIVYAGGTPWTKVHEDWLRRQRTAWESRLDRLGEYLGEDPH